MTTDYIAAGDTVPIAIRVMLAGVGVENAAVATVRIQRRSDGLWLNTTNETFGAWDAFACFRDLVPVTDDLSRYLYAWNTSTITNPVAGDIYFATIDVTAPHLYSVTQEISTALIPAVRLGLATSTNVTDSRDHVEAATTSAASRNVAGLWPSSSLAKSINRDSAACTDRAVNVFPVVIGTT